MKTGCDLITEIALLSRCIAEARREGAGHLHSTRMLEARRDNLREDLEKLPDLSFT